MQNGLRRYVGGSTESRRSCRRSMRTLTGNFGLRYSNGSVSAFQRSEYNAEPLHTSCWDIACNVEVNSVHLCNWRLTLPDKVFHVGLFFALFVIWDDERFPTLGLGLCGVEGHPAVSRAINSSSRLPTTLMVCTASGAAGHCAGGLVSGVREYPTHRQRPSI